MKENMYLSFMNTERECQIVKGSLPQGWMILQEGWTCGCKDISASHEVDKYWLAKSTDCQALQKYEFLLLYVHR